MPGNTAESGVPSWGFDFTMLEELSIATRDAKREDIGAMVSVFIKSFTHDKTAQLLYPHDGIWPVVVEMLSTYLDDEYTHLILAEDEYTDAIVGWTSVSLVTSGQEDYFKYCDSTVWAGRQLLRRESRARGQTPLHLDEMKRAALITKLRDQNRHGQNRYASEQRLVINTIAVHPDVCEPEIATIAYEMIDHARHLALEEHLPLWAQVPHDSFGDIEEIFRAVGFAKVGSFELDLTRFTNEGHRRRRNWGLQKWTQWVLRTENRDRGRRH